MPTAEKPNEVVFAPEAGGWIAVMAIRTRLEDGSWQLNASIASLQERAGAQPTSCWRGEVVLREGHRLAVGPEGALQVEQASDELRLRPLNTEAQDLALTSLQGSRLELSFV